MRDDHDGHAIGTECGQQCDHLVARHGIESGERLVEDHHLRGSRDLVRGALAAYPRADIHLRIVDGAYHELLNEPEGPGLIRDIIIWLGEH
mgnify:CR=1 FL=1